MRAARGFPAGRNLGLCARVHARAPRQRYGDMEYDWDNRVNTTSGTVSWRARLLGCFIHRIRRRRCPVSRDDGEPAIAFDPFTFVDLGSGKDGRC